MFPASTSDNNAAAQGAGDDLVSSGAFSLDGSHRTSSPQEVAQFTSN